MLNKLKDLHKAVKMGSQESQEMVTKKPFVPTKGWQHLGSKEVDPGVFHHVFEKQTPDKKYWHHQLSSSSNPSEGVLAEAQVVEGTPDDLFLGDKWGKGSYPILSTIKTTQKGMGSRLMQELLNHHKSLATDYKMSDDFNNMFSRLPEDKYDKVISPFYENTGDPAVKQQRHYVKLKDF